MCPRVHMPRLLLRAPQIQERQLDDRLERTQGALGQLEQEHRELQGSSADQLAKLRKDFGELQKHCDALEVCGGAGCASLFCSIVLILRAGVASKP